MVFPENKKEIMTSKGIELKAPVHRLNAIKDSYSNTLTQPLDEKIRKQFKVYKDVLKHEFVIDIEETELSVIIKLDGKQTIYDNGVLKFLSSQKINKQSVGGISLPEDVKKEIDAARSRLKDKSQQDKLNRENDRPSPKIDEAVFYIYQVGIDTGLIYPESHRSAIETILKKGIEPKMVFSGKRDRTRKYPGMHDSDIPDSYVQKEGDTFVAKGYAFVWSEDIFALPRKLVDLEIINIREKKQKIKVDREEKKAIIFAKAKETGERQLLNQWSEKCNDPDESCDVDNIYEYAMPDGTVKTERHHTW